MNNYICINGNKTELTEEQLKQLGIEVPKANPFNRAKLEEKYYCIDMCGKIREPHEAHDPIDMCTFNIANYCTDKSLMEQRALHETLNRLLWRYSMEHDGDKIDWNSSRSKWKIVYNHQCHKLEIHDNTSIGVIETPYFYTVSAADAAIKEIIEPFMKEHPEFKW